MSLPPGKTPRPGAFPPAPSTCLPTTASFYRVGLRQADSDWFLREAAKIEPHTHAYFTVLLQTRPHPQQAYRSCLGILDLARQVGVESGRNDGSYSSLLRSLAKLNLLILDDWMRDTITIQNTQDILEVLDDRFGHSSTIIASQVPVSEWHLRIPDPTLVDAILDRLVHNTQRIQLEGESQRKLRAERSMPNT